MQQIILKYGIIAGGASIGVALLFYFGARNLLVGSFGFLLSEWIALAALFFMAAKEAVRSGLSGRATLRALFAGFVISAAIYFAFEYVLYNRIDPALGDLQKRAMQAMFDAHLGAKTPKEINEYRQDIAAGNFHTVSATVMAMAQRLIGGFLLCAGALWLARKQAENRAPY